MKLFSISLVCLIVSITAYCQGFIPQEYTKSIKKADSLFTLKDYKKSSLQYSAAFQAMGWKATQTDRYNAARSWALAGNSDSALYCLNRLVDLISFGEYDKVINDSAFRSLYSDNRWKITLEAIGSNKIPEGWYREENMFNYKIGMDKTGSLDGKSAATIKSIKEDIIGSWSGDLTQDCSPGIYAGKRIRMTGFVKSKDVAKRAGLFLKVYHKTNLAPVAFDEMKNRPIKGTTEWKKYQIVIDIPIDASKMSFGALLNGTGQIWFDKINFEIVDKSVAITDESDPHKNPAPKNLDFEK